MQIQNNLKAYKMAIVLGLVGIFVYFFFAIGDLMIKGYSDLSFYPVGLMAIAIGVVIGLYLKEKKK